MLCNYFWKLKVVDGKRQRHPQEMPTESSALTPRSFFKDETFIYCGWLIASIVHFVIFTPGWDVCSIVPHVPFSSPPLRAWISWSIKSAAAWSSPVSLSFPSLCPEGGCRGTVWGFRVVASSSMKEMVSCRKTIFCQFEFHCVLLSHLSYLMFII